ncbi:hypothetical protein MCP1_40001 [Candidatus Terasakiella magnetica]|nr:hypothetical protein MCP1_40001 [Candidatus Terasakiella magnetica]
MSFMGSDVKAETSLSGRIVALSSILVALLCLTPIDGHCSGSRTSHLNVDSIVNFIKLKNSDINSPKGEEIELRYMGSIGRNRHLFAIVESSVSGGMPSDRVKEYELAEGNVGIINGWDLSSALRLDGIEGNVGSCPRIILEKGRNIYAVSEGFEPLNECIIRQNGGVRIDLPRLNASKAMVEQFKRAEQDRMKKLAAKKEADRLAWEARRQAKIEQFQKEKLMREQRAASISTEFTTIPDGCFQMGSDHITLSRHALPVHEVCVKSFEMAVYPVTLSFWQQVMGSLPPNVRVAPDHCSADCPVTKVEWQDIQLFLSSLNAQSGKTYRLPTEAEWEYAARGGTSTDWWCGNDPTCLTNSMVYRENSGGELQPVGSKLPNQFGLYDMGGNVDQWTQDCWSPDHSGAPVDGSARIEENCDHGVVRGGGYYSSPDQLRSAYRNLGMRKPDDKGVGPSPFVGFRLARMLP